MALITPQYLQTQSYTAAKDRYALSKLEGIQPGVFAAGDFKAAQRGAGANMSVDIAAGDAWVAGTDTTRQGAYMVTNDALVNAATDTTGVAWAIGHATLPRIDQVILRVFDTQDGSSANGNKTSDGAQLLVLLGTATAGATLDNRAGATNLPSSCIRLADVLVPVLATTVTTANIRDRRSWARGARFTVTRTQNAAAGSDYTTAATTMAAIDATNLSPRIECSGVPLKLTLLGRYVHSVAGGIMEIGFAQDGVLVDGITEAGAGWRTTPAAQDTSGVIQTWETTPVAGSHLFAPWWDVLTAGTGTIAANTARPLKFIVEEIVRQDASNT